MNNPILQIGMRYIHLICVIIAVGGVFFRLVCQHHAGVEPDDSMRKRMGRIQWFAVGGLIISGFYNWMLTAAVYKEAGAITNALLGVKVLLAMILFAVLWLQSSDIIKSDKLAGMINLHLAAIIILLAAIVRYHRLLV